MITAKSKKFSMAYKDDGKPFCMASFGQPDAGKSFDIERWMNQFKNRTRIVYNPGRATDWKDYESIELLIINKILHFKLRGKDYPFEANFMLKFENKKVKVKQAFERSEELLFLRLLSFTDSINNFNLVLDDATGVFGDKLTRAERIMLSKTKHKGCKLAFLSHDFNYFPKQAWGLLTHVRIFRTHNPPPKERRAVIKNHFDTIVNAWELLQTAPTYSYCTLDTLTGELFYEEFAPKKPKPPKTKKTSK